ncbi:MAG: polysaccharide biosynthesis protein, partial [uncultured bacterium]
MTFTSNILFNTLAQYLGKAISLVASILVTTILARRMGTSGYGQYVYLLSLVMFINAFADWGSTFVATRHASQHPDQRPTIYFTSLISRFMVSLVFQLGLIGFSLFLPQFKPILIPLVIASLLLPLTSIKMSFQIVFQSRFQLWRLSLLDTIAGLSFLLFLYLFSHTTLAALFLYLVVSSTISLLLGIYLLRPMPRPPIIFDTQFARYLFTQSLSMGALLTVYTIYNRVDIFILKYFHGDSAVGIYGLSYKVYDSLLLGAGYLANATFPLLSSRTSNLPLFRQAFEKYLATLIVLSLAASISLFLFAPFIIHFLAGPEFAPATTPLRLLALSLFVAYLGHSTGYSLTALGRQITSLKIALLALVINVGL